MYSIRDEMAYHGVYALPVSKMERKLHFIFRGSEEARKEKLVWLGIDHTEAV